MNRIDLLTIALQNKKSLKINFRLKEIVTFSTRERKSGKGVVGNSSFASPFLPSSSLRNLLNPTSAALPT